MNTFRKLLGGALVGASMLIFSAPSFAQSQEAGVSGVTIDTIYTYSSFAAVLYSPASSNGLCTSSIGDRAAVLDLTVEGSKNMLAMLLTAKATGQTIGFAMNNNCFSGWGNAPRIYRVDF